MRRATGGPDCQLRLTGRAAQLIKKRPLMMLPSIGKVALQGGHVEVSAVQHLTIGQSCIRVDPGRQTYCTHCIYPVHDLLNGASADVAFSYDACLKKSGVVIYMRYNKL